MMQDVFFSGYIIFKTTTATTITTVTTTTNKNTIPNYLGSTNLDTVNVMGRYGVMVLLPNELTMLS